MGGELYLNNRLALVHYTDVVGSIYFWWEILGCICFRVNCMLWCGKLSRSLMKCWNFIALSRWVLGSIRVINDINLVKCVLFWKLGIVLWANTSDCGPRRNLSYSFRGRSKTSWRILVGSMWRIRPFSQLEFGRLLVSWLFEEWRVCLNLGNIFLLLDYRLGTFNQMD